MQENNNIFKRKFRVKNVLETFMCTELTEDINQQIKQTIQRIQTVKKS